MASAALPRTATVATFGGEVSGRIARLAIPNEPRKSELPGRQFRSRPGPQKLPSRQHRPRMTSFGPPRGRFRHLTLALTPIVRP